MTVVARMWKESKTKAFQQMLVEAVELGYSIPQSMHDENARLLADLA